MGHSWAYHFLLNPLSWEYFIHVFLRITETCVWRIIFRTTAKPNSPVVSIGNLMRIETHGTVSVSAYGDGQWGVYKKCEWFSDMLNHISYFAWAENERMLCDNRAYSILKWTNCGKSLWIVLNIWFLVHKLCPFMSLCHLKTISLFPGSFGISVFSSKSVITLMFHTARI